MPDRQATMGAAGVGDGEGEGLIAAPDCAGDGLAGTVGGVATTTLPVVAAGERVAAGPEDEVQPPTRMAKATMAALARIKQA